MVTGSNLERKVRVIPKVMDCNNDQTPYIVNLVS